MIKNVSFIGNILAIEPSSFILEVYIYFLHSKTESSICVQIPRGKNSVAYQSQTSISIPLSLIVIISS